MVTPQSITAQLKKINFNPHGWGKAEVKELHHILLPDEEIYEVANGVYEGGFALLLATNIRVLLVDKKMLNYLNVEDLRFDMINEIDYSHRLTGANITITTGSKTLKFRSYNQPRLRKLINHVQHCMADSKIKQSSHQEDQKLHLEQINQQLQAYLVAQHQQQQKLHEQLAKVSQGDAAAAQAIEPPKPVEPSPELKDYLYAQSLLAQHQIQQGSDTGTPPQPTVAPMATIPLPPAHTQTGAAKHEAELYSEGVKEVFGNHPAEAPAAAEPAKAEEHHLPLELNAMRIAYAKLPMAMRNRKFGRPSFHAHTRAL